ncbi:MAG: NAD(P)/FAD-dependent oxidoreductase [Thermodesulfobacteriota bacterium]|nr:NAD(P)/FAD-dependent oxidoreductase [Thermodesulfobacteriota bacterium]
MSYDVIIAGAGPAGLTAAMTAVSEGLSVLLVETKENITRKTRPCCSMWLLEPGFHDEGWTFEDASITFHRNDFSIPYTGGIVDLYRSIRMSAQGNTLLMGKKLSPIGKVIDKEKLLEGLLEKIEKSRAEIRTRTTCLGVEEQKDGVRVLLRHLGKEEWVTGKYLLAADGVDSKVVQALGLNEKRKIIIRTPILHYYYADVQIPYGDAWVQFIGDGFNGVSGTLLHKPDTNGYSNVYEVGAVPPPKSGMGVKEAITRLLSHSIVKELLSGARLIKKMGCRWTLWDPILEPARSRVIIVGDAASFQEVENQGAIMCGYRAVKAVKGAEKGEDGFGQYNNFWQKSFEFNNPEILKNTWKAFIFGYLGNENLDYILSLTEGKMLDGYVNHFTCADVIFGFIKSQLPRIERERPDLAEKIKQFEHFSIEQNIVGEVKGS